MVAQLPASAQNDIIYGNEGVSYTLMTIDEYLSRADAWQEYQARTRDYMDTV